MRSRILKRIGWLSIFSAIDVVSVAQSMIDELKDIAKEYPNDSKFGAEIRKLISE